MRKVLNKSVFVGILAGLAINASALSNFAYAQMIDDKMMPPVLLVPPPTEETAPLTEIPDYFGDNSDEETPLSIYEVPVLDVPQQAELAEGEKPMRIGRFSLLHKVTAKITEIELRAGEELTVGELTLVMHDCLSAPPEEPPETRTFLQVSEFRLGTDKQLFSGWMFASTPGIHALEHPVFDLWPTACITEDGLVYTGDILPPAPRVN